VPKTTGINGSTQEGETTLSPGAALLFMMSELEKSAECYRIAALAKQNPLEKLTRTVQGITRPSSYNEVLTEAKVHEQTAVELFAKLVRSIALKTIEDISTAALHPPTVPPERS
jgi:hypothetical protein